MQPTTTRDLKSIIRPVIALQPVYILLQKHSASARAVGLAAETRSAQRSLN